jgi:hypothetical protein
MTQTEVVCVTGIDCLLLAAAKAIIIIIIIIIGIELQQMWNLKCTIISVIIGTTGIVTRTLRKNFEDNTRKTFDRFTTKDNYTWNITRNTESTAL